MTKSEPRRVQLKRLASCTLGKMIQSAPAERHMLAPYLRAAHVQPNGRVIELPDQRMWFSSGELSTLTLRRGDVVVVEGGAGYGRSAVLPEDLAGWGFQNSIVRLRPLRTRADGRFLDYAIQAALLSGEIEAAVSTATISHFTAEKVARLPIAELPLDDQVAIADFLDRETAQIDAFIAKNEELITLLTERRKAVIARLVTKGLRDEKLKPSGIDWAGDVPESWQVGNLRRFAAMHTGHTPSRQHPEYWLDCDIPWFTLADVWQLRQGRRMMAETSESISEVGLANSAAELLPAGTVALSRTASVGFPGVMEAPMATSQDFWNWIPSSQVVSEYLWYQFLAMRSEFERLMTGSTHLTIYQADAASLQVVIPPVEEQAEIVTSLDEEIGRVDAALDAAGRAIELARERRAALISAAVTGKFDVGVSA